MKKIVRVWGPRRLWVLGLLFVGLVAGLAEAGKPSSGPVLLAGAGSYVETPLFNSGAVLTAVQGATAINPAVGSISMGGAEFLSLVRGVEVDTAGAVYAIFDAPDANSTSKFTGIVRYEDGVGVSVALANAWDYENASHDSGHGSFIWGMDLVPTQDATASGPLRAGDLVVSRWIDDDETVSLTDGRHEVVLFRPDASGALVEQQVLRSFSGVEDLIGGIQMTADHFGSVYLWVQGQQDTGGELAGGLYRLIYNSATLDHSDEELVQFPFEINGNIEVDDVGGIYVQGAGSTSQAGVIFHLLAGEDPATDSTEYATFTESFNIWTFDNGTFAIAMHDLDYVGLIEADLNVVYADRIADSAPRGLMSLTADGAGSVYVVHEDKILVSNRQTASAGFTVYRLDLDTSGGGDSGGGGNGGGKGKKK